MKRFLIFSPPRCGSTKLIYELESRTTHDEEVYCEPSNVSLQERRRFGSTYAQGGLGAFRNWIVGKPRLRGMKVVSIAYPELAIDHSAWVEANLDLFDRIVILHRSPVEICISLEAARLHRHWNILDESDHKKDRQLSRRKLKVSVQTLEAIRRSLISCTNVLNNTPDKIVRLLYPDFLRNLESVAEFVGVSLHPIREPRFDVRAVRTGARYGLEICENLDEVESFFDACSHDFSAATHQSG